VDGPSGPEQGSACPTVEPAGRLPRVEVVRGRREYHTEGVVQNAVADCLSDGEPPD
jgi:hypothetical protein